MAKQAACSITAQYGDTVVLAALCVDPSKTDFSFVPFAIDYMERSYAAGLIRGSRYNKREGRPKDAETVAARMIDRPLRPFFPDDYRVDTRVQIMVLSADKENDPAQLSMLASAAALRLAPQVGLPPIGCAKVGRIDGNFVLNPTRSQLEESDFELTLSCTRERVVMIEFGGKQIPTSDVADAIAFGFDATQETIDLIEALAEETGADAPSLAQVSQKPDHFQQVLDLFADDLRQAICAPDKATRKQQMAALTERVKERMAEADPDLDETAVTAALSYATKRVLRQLAVEGVRCDGRDLRQIRPIQCHVGILPKTHGSAVFSRGETQAAVAATLGTREDEQHVEELTGEYYERFLLHYNFPPFSVGEAGFIRGPSRRDIGHGFLARKALLPLVPAYDDFPYTIRVVSDILESCASSSMATVCGANLALMDAGIPLAAPVSGISIGLVEEGNQVQFLTDIMDEEDFHGDMDFKVAATETGVTAIQMDVKNTGLTVEMAAEALRLAEEANRGILPIMGQTLSEPRPLSMLAPRVIDVKIDPELIGKIVGPGGATIRALVERTQSKIDIADEGIVHIVSDHAALGEEAAETIRLMSQRPEEGQTYDGVVTGVQRYGAFIEIMPGTEGLLHISDVSDDYVENIDDVIRVGDRLRVTVASIGDMGRVRLTREGREMTSPPPSGGSRDRRGGRDDRGRDRGGRDRGPRGRRDDSGRGGRPPRGDGRRGGRRD